MASGCELCEQDGGILLLQTPQWRVIRSVDADHPAFYRVIWNDHVSEWTDLSTADRAVMMGVVEAVEGALRAHLQPTKVNLASLGNVVPHLHWHVIARWQDDSHFPECPWGPVQRDVPADVQAERRRMTEALKPVLREALEKRFGC